MSISDLVGHFCARNPSFQSFVQEDQDAIKAEMYRRTANVTAAGTAEHIATEVINEYRRNGHIFTIPINLQDRNDMFNAEQNPLLVAEAHARAQYARNASDNIHCNSEILYRNLYAQILLHLYRLIRSGGIYMCFNVLGPKTLIDAGVSEYHQIPDGVAAMADVLYKRDAVLPGIGIAPSMRRALDLLNNVILNLAKFLASAHSKKRPQTALSDREIAALEAIPPLEPIKKEVMTPFSPDELEHTEEICAADPALSAMARDMTFSEYSEPAYDRLRPLWESTLALNFPKYKVLIVRDFEKKSPYFPTKIMAQAKKN
ncbi:MAG: hypothetical protein LBC42_02410 [Puniceicoccales bacterium]|jgi:hypothetical protein|nr:hypothetical protein [Puniceicoccales bacterium]